MQVCIKMSLQGSFDGNTNYSYPDNCYRNVNARNLVNVNLYFKTVSPTKNKIYKILPRIGIGSVNHHKNVYNSIFIIQRVSSLTKSRRQAL